LKVFDNCTKLFPFSVMFATVSCLYKNPVVIAT
jgi:hypothetical protein